MAGARGLAVDLLVLHVVRDPAQQAAGPGTFRPILRAAVQPFPELTRAPARGVGEQNLRCRNLRRDGERARGAFEFREPTRRRRKLLRARQRVQPRLPDEALEHVGDGRNPPASLAPGFEPPAGFLQSRAAPVVRQRIEEVTGGALRGLRAGGRRNSRHAAPERRGGCRGGCRAVPGRARSPAAPTLRAGNRRGTSSSRRGRPRSRGRRSFAPPAPPSCPLPCALDLAQGVFLAKREPPDVLQGERLYDFESHGRPADALRFT